MEKIGHFLEDEVSKLYQQAKDKGFSKKDASPYIEENLSLKKVLKRSSKNWDGGYAMAGLVGHGDAFVLRDPNGIDLPFFMKMMRLSLLLQKDQLYKLFLMLRLKMCNN